MAREDEPKIEPLLHALEETPDKPSAGRVAARPRLGWRLLWAALVVLALLAIVLNQAF
jgi:hypothetical protein